MNIPEMELLEKYKKWKEHCARPYSKHRNAREYNRVMNKENRQTLKQKGPLTSTIYDLIPLVMKLELNKMR